MSVGVTGLECVRRFFQAVADCGVLLCSGCSGFFLLQLGLWTCAETLAFFKRVGVQNVLLFVFNLVWGSFVIQKSIRSLSFEGFRAVRLAFEDGGGLYRFPHPMRLFNG